MQGVASEEAYPFRSSILQTWSHASSKQLEAAQARTGAWTASSVGWSGCRCGLLGSFTFDGGMECAVRGCGEDEW